MNIKLTILILAGLTGTGLAALKAESPAVDASGVVNSSPSDLNSPATPFFYYNQSLVPVNENEVKAGLLYDAVNSKVVWQKNISKVLPIASLTKMMVALLAVEDVRAGKYSWTDRVTWTREYYVGKRKSRRKVHTQANYSLMDLFKASMIASNNECSEQMARYLGNGNLQSTIDRMNARAKELCMMNTYYGNPTGLPAPHMMFDNASTPSDMLLLTLEMLKYNEVLDIASMGYASIENGKSSSVISNHNRLTIDYSGEVDGLKTGYTRRAGFCLVATTAKCEHRLVSIVLGCRGPQIRNEVVRDMFNDYYLGLGLDKLGPYSPAPLKSDENLARVQSGDGKYVTVYEKGKKIHVVKRGESLSTIALKYKCSTTQLKSWNKGSVYGSKILAGQKLAVYVNKPKSIFIQNPVNGTETEDDKQLITETEKKDLDKAGELADASSGLVEKAKVSPSQKYVYHVVEPGDTLFNIALKYKGITVEELKSLNKITNTRSLKPGTKIKVKVKA
jgi:D-alanyl-D-alanine carboxypeptidase (penicillin-binding protein 5/6)